MLDASWAVCGAGHSMIARRAMVAMLACGAAGRAAAAEAVTTTLADPIRTEWVMDLVVTCSTPQRFNGDGAIGAKDGERDVFFPIIGGRFAGPRLRGEVVPGGADFPVKRPDGVYAVDALYRLRTDDGVVIVIHNRGLVYEPFTKLRLTPEFLAPRGRHDWLNKSIFLATLALEVPAHLRLAKGPEENDRLIQVHRVV